MDKNSRDRCLGSESFDIKFTDCSCPPGLPLIYDPRLILCHSSGGWLAGMHDA